MNTSKRTIVTSMTAVTALAMAACSGASPVAVVMTTGDGPPAYGATPYPTDALRDGDHVGMVAGLDHLVARHGDLVTAHLAALDGFGVRPLIEFFIDGSLDPASIPTATTAATDGAGLVDVDPDSPEHGRVVAMDWRYDADRGVVQGSPSSGALLREGTRYAAFITSELRTPDGKALARASGLTSLAGARWKTTADAARELDDPRLAGIAVFTTQHATRDLIAARTTLDDRTIVPAPTLAFADPTIIFSGATQLQRLMGTATRASDGPRAGLERWGSDNPTGIAHDHVGVVGTGQMTVARFRGDKTGTNGPEDKTFQIDPATGTPRLIAVDTIPVTFILPAAPPPAAGYPIVIYGHGLGAGRDQLLAFAEPLTSRGYALVGIDMFGHGSRFDPTDQRNNLANQLPMFTGDPSLHDGFGDNTGLNSTFGFFEGFLDVAAVRDSIRQSALDLSRLSELIHRSDLDLTALAPDAKLDTSHVAYMGESFGTVVGTVFSAIEPNIDLYVLDVPGGGIVDKLLPSSADIGSLALPLVDSIYGPKSRLDRWSPLIGSMQAVIDGADPLTYAPHVLADRFTIAGQVLGPRSVVCIEVVGDQVLSNVGTEALVRGFGLDVLTPDLAPPSGLVELASPASANRDGQTAILVQYEPATHGGNWQAEHGTLKYLPGFPFDGDNPFPLLPLPVKINNPIYATQQQVGEILDTHQAGLAPLVRSTLAPVADFDDDGVPDDQDMYPYDPTRH